MHGIFSSAILDTNTTTRVSVNYAGEQAVLGGSDSPFISGDGRYVAFESGARNLIEGEDLGYIGNHIYVHDRTNNAIVRASVSSDELYGNDNSYYPTLSDNGRYVAFLSYASNLVSGDTNSKGDIFVRDIVAGNTMRVSVDSSNGQADDDSNERPAISGNGLFVAFESSATNLVSGDTNATTDIFVHNITTGATTRASVGSGGVQGTGYSAYAAISDDGRYVAFYSGSSTLVPGDTNFSNDIFVHDRTTALTSRVSVDSNGLNDSQAYNPAISGDGSTVSFESYYSYFVDGDSYGDNDIFISEIDFTAPTVTSTSLEDNYSYGNGPSSFTITFSKAMTNPYNNTDPGDVTNPSNYLLVNDDGDGFQTASCDIGVHAYDSEIIINSVDYDSETYTATININDGVPLPGGEYRLFICGTTSLYDGTGNKINGGTDTTYLFSVSSTDPAGQNPSAGASSASSLPQTGFAPESVTLLPIQSASSAYQQMDSISLEIPALDIDAPIIGVPFSTDEWDLTWLGNRAGWLAGTAFPSWAGNSAITAHVYDANGQPGLFNNLGNLKWGDQVIVHAYGQAYVYEVRSVDKYIQPKDTSSVFKHEDYPWLTLITCQGYDDVSDSYRWRIAVRAVQVEIK